LIQKGEQQADPGNVTRQRCASARGVAGMLLISYHTPARIRTLDEPHCSLGIRLWFLCMRRRCHEREAGSPRHGQASPMKRIPARVRIKERRGGSVDVFTVPHSGRNTNLDEPHCSWGQIVASMHERGVPEREAGSPRHGQASPMIGSEPCAPEAASASGLAHRASITSPQTGHGRHPPGIREASERHGSNSCETGR